MAPYEEGVNLAACGGVAGAGRLSDEALLQRKRRLRNPHLDSHLEAFPPPDNLFFLPAFFTRSPRWSISLLLPEIPLSWPPHSRPMHPNS